MLRSLDKRRRTFVAGCNLLHQGQSDQAAYLLTYGWACSCKFLEDGQRQVVDVQIPGDFLRQLREAGMVMFRDGFVAFDDYNGLTGFAQFDPSYKDQGEPLLP